MADRILTFKFDVSNLTQEQIDGLVMEVCAQHERSDNHPCITMPEVLLPRSRCVLCDEFNDDDGEPGDHQDCDTCETCKLPLCIHTSHNGTWLDGDQCALTRIFVVEACHEGTAMCVRRATPEEAQAEYAKVEGWAMELEPARELSRKSAVEHGQQWFDFSEEP